MKDRKIFGRILLNAGILIVVAIIFLVPFLFMLMTASKSPSEAALLRFGWSGEFRLFENISEVMLFGDGRTYRALFNSMLLTVGAVALIILLSALVGFVMQRRQGRIASIAGSIMLAGLIIPPSVVPTIFLLKALMLYKTLIGMILVDVAFLMPFAILIFRAFMYSIPRELDEAAIMDGLGPLRVFFSIILPMLKPAIVTIIVVASVAVYNDFVGPLYFLPGNENVTVQLTLYGFISQFQSQYNLLFTDAIIITIPPLILFIFFQRQIVSGMTAGAIRG